MQAPSQFVLICLKIKYKDEFQNWIGRMGFFVPSAGHQNSFDSICIYIYIYIYIIYVI